MLSQVEMFAASPPVYGPTTTVTATPANAALPHAPPPPSSKSPSSYLERATLSHSVEHIINVPVGDVASIPAVGSILNRSHELNGTYWRAAPRNRPVAVTFRKWARRVHVAILVQALVVAALFGIHTLFVMQSNADLCAEHEATEAALDVHVTLLVSADDANAAAAHSDDTIQLAIVDTGSLDTLTNEQLSNNPNEASLLSQHNDPPPTGNNAGVVVSIDDGDAPAVDSADTAAEASESANRPSRELFTSSSQSEECDTLVTSTASMPSFSLANSSARSSEPLVSFIIPCFNGFPFLPDALSSILAQTYRNIEVIAVDDGSTDATLAYLHETRMKDSRLFVLALEHKGLPAALNAGMERARGDFVTWGSSDNIYLQNFAETLVDLLTEYPEAGFAHGQHTFILDNANLPEPNSKQKYNFDTMAFDFLFHWKGLAAFMWRREVAVEVGAFNEGLHGVEDWDYWMRILEINPFHPVSRRVLYYYRLHGMQMTKKIEAENGYSALEASLVRSLVARHGGRIDHNKLVPIAALTLDKRRSEAISTFMVGEAALGLRPQVREAVTERDLHKDLYDRSTAYDPSFYSAKECVEVLNGRMFPSGVRYCHRYALYARFSSMLTGTTVPPRNTFLNKCGLLGQSSWVRATTECNYDAHVSTFVQEEIMAIADEWILQMTYHHVFPARQPIRKLVIFVESDLPRDLGVFNPFGYFRQLVVFVPSTTVSGVCTPVCTSTSSVCVVHMGATDTAVQMHTHVQKASLVRAYGLAWACERALEVSTGGAPVVCSVGHVLDGRPPVSDEGYAFARRADMIIAGSSSAANRLLAAGIPSSKVKVVADGIPSTAVIPRPAVVAPNAPTEHASISADSSTVNSVSDEYRVFVDATGKGGDSVIPTDAARVVINALPSLPDNYVATVIIDSNEDRSFLRKVVNEQGVSSRVSFVESNTVLRGFAVLDPDHTAVLSVGEWRAAPNYEPTTVDLLAMAAGIPVLACGTGSQSSEEVGDNAEKRATPSPSEQEAVRFAATCYDASMMPAMIRETFEMPILSAVRRRLGEEVARRRTSESMARLELFVYRLTMRQAQGTTMDITDTELLNDPIPGLRIF